MVKDLIFLQTEIFSSESISMEERKAMDSIVGLTAMLTVELLSMEKKMAKVFGKNLLLMR